METRKAHWNDVYAARDETALTWYEETPERSLALIGALARPGDAIIDIGGGASRLCDHLLEEGHGRITVLDLSASAIAASKARLGDRAGAVKWIEADITRWRPDRTYAVWHDRAVFHFLTDAADRAAYVRALDAATEPGAIAIIATFALSGPEQCSGLPVVRYSPQTLERTLAALAPGRFRLVEGLPHIHVTPKGNRQDFQISVFRKAG